MIAHRPLLEQERIRCCRETLINWSCPSEIEFRPNLPLHLGRQGGIQNP
ncbi:MAG: hypothetical protein V6Z89_21945 [Desulfobacter sp.]